MRLWTFLILLGVCILSAFLPSLALDYHLLDDETYIINNALVTAPVLSWKALLYSRPNSEFIPFYTLTNRWIFQGIGNLPEAFRIAGLLLHMANVALLAWLFRRLSFPTVWILVCTTFFAIAPVQNESLVWISSRKEIQATFFLLWSLVACDFYLEKRRPWHLISMYGCFTLALLSKSSMVSLPLFWIALIAYRQGGGVIKLKYSKVYLLALAGSAAFFIFLYQTAASKGAIQTVDVVPLGQRLLANIHIWGKIYLPHLFSIHHMFLAYPESLAWNGVQFSWGVTALFIMGLVIAYKFQKEENRRGFMFAAVFFLLGFLPYAQWFKTSTAAQDHYFYVTAGIMGLVVGGLLDAVSKKSLKIFLSLGFCVFYSLYCIRLHHQQSKMWQGAAFAEPLLKEYPRSVHGMLIKSEYLLRNHQIEKSNEVLESMVMLYPPYDYARKKLLSYYLERGNVEKIKTHCALLDTYHSPRDVEANYLLGSCADAMALPLEIVRTYLQKCLQLEPTRYECHLRLGMSLLRNGFFEEAEKSWQRIPLNSELYITAAYNRALLHGKLGRIGEATNLLEQLQARCPECSETKNLQRAVSGSRK